MKDFSFWRMRAWEWAFPALAAALVLWATLPDLAHFCGFFEWSLTCGMGWIFRLDMLLPAIAVVAIWGWVRTVILWRYFITLLGVLIKEGRGP